MIWRRPPNLLSTASRLRPRRIERLAGLARKERARAHSQTDLAGFSSLLTSLSALPLSTNFIGNFGSSPFYFHAYRRDIARIAEQNRYSYAIDVPDYCD